MGGRADAARAQRRRGRGPDPAAPGRSAIGHRRERDSVTGRPGVLLVTGAYYPEMSGAGLQTRSLVRRLSDRIAFLVLTTTADRSLPLADRQDGIDVYRIFIDPRRWWSKALGIVRFTRAFLRASHRFSIVHLHGFSQKSILLVALARLTGKKVAIKLTSVGHDDPLSMRARNRVAFAAFSRAHAFFAVSPAFREAYDAAGLPPARFHLIPNGVDLDRFRPATAAEREAVRREIEIPPNSPLVLFVGFFSREKRPDVLFEAWASIARSSAPDSFVLFVGATRAPYYEIDRDLADTIRRRAADRGLSERLRFIESTHQIERVHRAANVFVMTSVREGMPNALLEAMASGTPCIATRLAGVTDRIIQDGHNGVLVPSDDVAALSRALATVIGRQDWARRLGCEGRRTIEARFNIERTSESYLGVYQRLMNT